MRAIIQRVWRARVRVDSEVISEIGRGLCVLVGMDRDDTDVDIDFMVKKLLHTRLFENGEKKRWTRSVSDERLEILCVSQFTLHHTLKGNKPDFRKSMGAEEAPLFYEKFLNRLKAAYEDTLVKDGKFGAYMQVDICNDGPVTICIDSKNKGNETWNDEELLCNA